ncbi:ABC multidrug transporter [Xylariomycetidae sp. FL2044]|nr:ABC multidrug transporter [Xylariomycetidae sp. FL2044]
MIGLSFLDHNRCPRPSILLSSYVFLTLIFDVVQVRTYWLASSTRAESAFAAIFSTSFAVKVGIVFLEAQQKVRWVKWENEEHSPEETSGIFSLGVYFWLNKLFLKGYRGVMKVTDLYSLDSNISADILHGRFAHILRKSNWHGQKYGLALALARSLAVPLILPVPARLLLSAFRLCQPLLINSLLEYLTTPEASPVNHGYGFIGASFFIYSGIAISTALYWYFQHRMVYMGRACLVTAIYTKATEASITSGEESNASLTLMSTDIERIIFGFRNLHEILASPIEVAIASWLLYRQVGAAFVAPIIIISIGGAAVAFLMRFTARSQKLWMAGVTKRVGLTSEVIGSMKNLKISGLSAPIAEFVQKLRVDELLAGSRFRKITIISAVFAFAPQMISPFTTFAISQRSFDAANLFTSLSYLTLMTTPLSQVFQYVPQLISAFACLDRIQKFLEGKNRDDFRVAPGELSLDTEKTPMTSDDHDMSSAIKVENASFGWDAEKMILSNINFEVTRHSLTMIVGPIASGKSTLCQALLGEVPYSRGKIIGTRARCGYCDQSAFLSNGSVRDNIVGFSPFDAERYSQVLDASMLRPDLQTFPKGDRTNIGSNGITLSGGQKQRVSLARALYLETDLLILDDILSGLDADTEDQVFQKTFGPKGLLRERGSTVILCTHSVRHLPAAQHIIALGNGKVVEQGAFDDLIANESYVQSLGIRSSSASANSDEKLDAITEKAGARSSMLAKTTTLSSMISEVDKTARQHGDRTVYKTYIQSMGNWLAASLFFLGLCCGFFSNFPTVWLKFWADEAVAETHSHSSAYYIGIYAALQIGAMFSLITLVFFIMILVISRAGASLHHDALTTLMHASIRFFTTTDQGVITNLFSQDLNLIDTELPMALLNVIFAIFQVIGQAAVIATSSPYLAISYPFLAGVLYVIQMFYLRTSRQLRLLDLESKSPLYTHFLDTTKGIVTLRAFGYIAEDCAKNISLLNTSQRPAYLLVMIQQWLTLVLSFAVTIIAVLLTVLATQLRSNGGFTGASLVTLMSFGEALSALITWWTQTETSIGAIGRLKSFSDDVGSEDKNYEDLIPDDEWPQRGEVSLKGVSASYGTDEPSDKADLVLKHIELLISPGEKVAICGPSGGGKSSLIALLLKLLDPLAADNDAVLIDNTPLQRIDRATLRRRIIAVPQDTVFLPNGSTYQANLDPFGVATEADAQSVLKAVDLWVLVLERGGLQAGMVASTLSQGQRQLFSLARAVLRRRVRGKSLGLGGGGTEGGVLLLDEVSSSVDQETEKLMQEIIRQEFKSYTVIAVSHRLDMIMDFDRVVVLDKGAIVEVGNPRRLVAEPGTRFGELWNLAGR